MPLPSANLAQFLLTIDAKKSTVTTFYYMTLDSFMEKNKMAAE